MAKYCYTACFIFLISASLCFPQSKTADSLFLVLKSQKADSSKAKTLIALTVDLKVAGKYSEAIRYAREAVALSEKINYTKGLVDGYNNLGINFSMLGDYKSALENFFELLRLNREVGQKPSIATSLNNIGNVYYYLGNYPEALKYYLQSLKIYEDLHDDHGISMAIGNIAIVYEYEGDIAKAIEYNLKAIEISEKLKDKGSLAINFYNAGNAYSAKGDYETALSYYKKSMDLNKELGDRYGIANCNLGVGNILQDRKKFKEALPYYELSLAINREIGNKTGEVYTLGNMGKVYCELGYVNKGIGYLQQNLKLAEELGALEELQAAHEFLSNAYSRQKKFEQAISHYKLFVQFRDSIHNDQNIKKQVQLEMNYDFGKKEQAMLLAQKEKETLHKAELEKQTMQRNAFIGGFALMIALAGVSYRSYRNKRKAHAEIAKQKSLVDLKNHEIEEKNKEVMDSIAYASRIQRALITSEKYIEKSLRRLKQ